MLTRKLKKVTYPLRLPNLNSPCKRISTHIDVHELSEDEHRPQFLKQNSMTLPAATFVPLQGCCLRTKLPA